MLVSKNHLLRRIATHSHQHVIKHESFKVVVHRKLQIDDQVNTLEVGPDLVRVLIKEATLFVPKIDQDIFQIVSLDIARTFVVILGPDLDKLIDVQLTYGELMLFGPADKGVDHDGYEKVEEDLADDHLE